MKKFLIFVLLFASPLWAADNCANLPAATVLPWNGLEATPVMGYNSWYDSYTSPTEAHMKAEADLLVSSSLKASGYDMVQISEGWPSATRVSGNIVANTTNFPDGMAATISYIHGDGLAAGIYSSPYVSTCGGFTGSGTFEAADAATFASWGADYLEYDGCSVQSLYGSCWSTKYQQVWQMMAQDIRATGHNIIMMLGTNPPVIGSGTNGDDDPLSLNWGNNAGYNEIYFPWHNLFGGGGAGWSTLAGEYMSLATGLYRYERPGYFPHCDYLVGPTLNSAFGTTFFTQTQSQTQMGLYALWGCPLVISEDISTIPSPLLAIYENSGVIAVDQDALAHAAILYQQFTCGSSTCQVWVKPLKGGAWAMGLLNLDSASHTIAVNFTNFGGNPEVQDLWAGTDLGALTSYSTTVASDSIAMIKVIPAAGAAHAITNAQLENMAIQ